VTRYEIIDLGTFGGFTSVALGINNKRQVVGGADGTDGRRRAYPWDNGTLTDLGNIGRVAHYGAWDINENTQIVGTVTGSGNIEDAFIWENGQMTELGDTAQAKSALAINDAGQIVGAAIFPPPISAQHAMLLENGVLTDLTAAGFCSGIAWDINNLGHVTGGLCIWQNGKNLDLGNLGGELGGGLGINDRNEVVGTAERNPFEGIFHAFLWQDGQMTDIGLLVEPLANMVNSKAEAINNKGQIVGAGTVQFGVAAGAFSEGFLYDPIHGPMLLEDTLAPNSGCQSFPRATSTTTAGLWVPARPPVVCPTAPS